MENMILTSSFSSVNARACLEASDWVYGHECHLVTTLCHAHIFEVEADGQGLMADSHTAKVLAFRGSASIRDWLTDAQFARTAIGAGEEVHHGFLDAIVSANEWLKSLAAQYTPTAVGDCMPPLFVTGHSLGGAMALLAARQLAEAGARVMAVYTFGGPRVGNGTWAQRYDERVGARTWRVVNEEDIVPRVPGALTGYRHAGHEVFFPALGLDYIFDPPIWKKLLSDAAGTWLGWRRGQCAQLANHSIFSYALRLGASLQEDTQVA